MNDLKWYYFCFDINSNVNNISHTNAVNNHNQSSVIITQQQLSEMQQKLQETVQELAHERSERDQKISDVIIILNHSTSRN